MTRQSIGDFPIVVSRGNMYIEDKPIRIVRCKNRHLGEVWKRSSRKAARNSPGKPWRAEHARNRAVTFHRTMADAVAELVRTETQFPTQGYTR